jgi:hypothetical protein
MAVAMIIFRITLNLMKCISSKILPQKKVLKIFALKKATTAIRAIC